ncbi:MAG: hypothetical protein H2054_07885 [Sphingomonas sp.]|uniref:hypothetical protein n=1 Tax=Sphingomonas sp. TaxID=28214 RepID=UPI000DB7CE36|nr:hypothetical protein [Zymomonas sp.]MBA4773013.1 hypothetical protein [Sphingomonas sp.]PZP19554.1 MAG: hypothetical protein DI607_02135 [Sphingomonas hengshuiensis]
MRGVIGCALLLMLAACSSRAEQSEKAGGTPPDLETAAISVGIIPDPKATDIGGLFARDTDRVCIVPDALDYRIGVFVDYGDVQSCSGSGKVTRAGETLQIVFDDAPDCAFAARYEGDRIVFPGRVPSACERLCTRRASLGALDVRRLSDSIAEARTLRGAKGRLLCAP